MAHLPRLNFSVVSHFCPVMGNYFMWLTHSSLCQFLLFLGFVLHIRFLWLVHFLSFSCVRLCPPHSFKGGFVLNFMDLSIVSLLWFYPLFQGRFIYFDFRRLVSIVVVWIRPLLAYKAWLYGCYQFVCFDLFRHEKEAAASTVCLTGFPCRFFCFFPMTGFLFIFLFSLL